MCAPKTAQSPGCSATALGMPTMFANIDEVLALSSAVFALGFATFFSRKLSSSAEMYQHSAGEDAPKKAKVAQKQSDATPMMW